MRFPSRRIEVVIDELILHGIEPRHSHAVTAGLRSELAVALADWCPPVGADLDQLDTGAFRHRTGLAPDALGQAVARHIADALPSKPVRHQGGS
jgi:hypothetical protein